MHVVLAITDVDVSRFCKLHVTASACLFLSHAAYWMFVSFLLLI
jgi:hypothetical protein